MKRLSIIFSILFLVQCLGFNFINSKNIDEKSNGRLIEKNPTKELMISTLKDLFSELQKGNYDLAKKYLIIPENITDEELIGTISKLIEKKEISIEGINILENKGVFGKVESIYGEKGKREIKKKNLNPKSCYGLYIEFTNVEVMAKWDVEGFRFFRLDNIGKLEK